MYLYNAHPCPVTLFAEHFKYLKLWLSVLRYKRFEPILPFGWPLNLRFWAWLTPTNGIHVVIETFLCTRLLRLLSTNPHTKAVTSPGNKVLKKYNVDFVEPDDQEKYFTDQKSFQ